MGVSESIYSSLPKDIIQNIPSPVILMRVEKNDIEQEGMRKAHITDGVAMCETLSYLEQKVSFFFVNFISSNFKKFFI